MFNGYAEAAEIDEQISNLLDDASITKDTARQWHTFVRTLRTSLDLIDTKIVALPKKCDACDGTGKVPGYYG